MSERLRELNLNLYGEVNDWRLAFEKNCTRAGAAEFAVHQRLSRKSVSGTYYERTGVLSECRELFRCTRSEAVEAVRAAIQAIERPE